MNLRATKSDEKIGSLQCRLEYELKELRTVLAAAGGHVDDDDAGMRGGLA